MSVDHMMSGVTLQKNVMEKRREFWVYAKAFNFPFKPKQMCLWNLKLQPIKKRNGCRR